MSAIMMSATDVMSESNEAGWPALVGKEVGNYRLIKEIGSGGFGAVYQAEHVTLKNTFAVKLLHPRLAQGPQGEHFIERFQQEAYVMAELRHENVVQVIDFGFAEGIGFYLISEWLEGRSLFKIWRQTEAPEWGWILALFSQLLDALDNAHERGIVHRDLKPENIMLTVGSRNRMLSKIVDYGIATLMSEQYGDFSPTTSGSQPAAQRVAIGTPYYMAPEQATGALELVDHRSDLYACGVMLAELLTGQRVFDGGSNQKTMRLQVEALPPKLSELNPEREFPEAIEAVVAKALSKDRDMRFQSAHEFYQALRAAMQTVDVEPIWEDIYQHVEPSEKPLNQRKAKKRQYQMLRPSTGKRDTMLGLVVGILLVGLLGALAWSFFGPTPPPPRRKIKRKVIVVKIEYNDEDDAGTTVSPKSIPDRGSAIAGTASPDAGPAQVRRLSPPPRRRRRRYVARRRSVKRRILKRRVVARRAPPTERRSTPRPPPPRRVVMVGLRLSTTPAGAAVIVGGKRVGTTPYTLKKPVGQRTKILIKKSGYMEVRYTWSPLVSAGKSFTLVEKLLP